MDMIADIFLTAGALGAAFYCMVLSRRLNRFNDLEKGVGGAVAVLSAQVDDMTKTIETTRKTATASAENLTTLTERAEDVAKRLELLVASMHDIPQEPPAVAPVSAAQEAVAEEKPEAIFVRHADRNMEAAR